VDIGTQERVLQIICRTMNLPAAGEPPPVCLIVGWSTAVAVRMPTKYCARHSDVCGSDVTICGGRGVFVRLAWSPPAYLYFLFELVKYSETGAASLFVVPGSPVLLLEEFLFSALSGIHNATFVDGRCARSLHIYLLTNQ
jgi:hypothetical protein